MMIPEERSFWKASGLIEPKVNKRGKMNSELKSIKVKKNAIVPIPVELSSAVDGTVPDLTSLQNLSSIILIIK